MASASKIEICMDPMAQDVDLILGTAQFGLDYGITNRNGQVTDETLDTILAHAHKRLTWLDTSIKYGDALARLSRDSARPFSIVTKIDGTDPEAISAEIEESLRQLHRDRLDIVLFHTPTIFDDRQRAAEAAAALRAEVERGRVGHIGASLYDRKDVENALTAFRPDIVQLPASIADTRLLDDGTATGLERLGIDIHYRSVFLQGLLLSEPHRLPSAFRPLANLLAAIDRIADRHGVTRQDLCMGWVMAMPGARGLVCGVVNASELDKLVASHAAASALTMNEEVAEMVRLISIEDWMRDPRQWSQRS